MPAYNFKSIFAEPVRSGIKYTTIRQVRVHPTKPGDTLYLYMGLRTKQAELLRTSICQAVTPISITPKDGFILDGHRLTTREKDDLCQLDTAGLWTYPEFTDFFRLTYGPRFYGELIRWEPLPA